MIKIFKTLRNHWKKSVFAGVAGYYGVNYLVDKRKRFMMMRALCEEAGKQGELPLPMGAHNKHITLFFNPAASARKSRNKFEKFAEPLLHMAGFLVTIVKTERIDEAKELAGLIEKTNVLAVAGGDGTLSEVVTGLLRREDANEAVKMYPIGVIPVGTENEFAKSLFKFDSQADEAAQISQATMAIVKHQVVCRDVMQIKVLETSEEEVVKPIPQDQNENDTDSPTEVKVKPKPVYALSGLRLGMFREALKIKADLPTMLGEYFNTFWAFMRTDADVFKAEIKYTPACPGCLNCYQEEIVERNLSFLSRIASFFLPRKAPEKVKPSTVNEECGKWTTICVETPEFNIKHQDDGSLAMEIGKRLNTTEFLQQGFKLISNEQDSIENRILFNEAEIIPIKSPQFCSIDGEEFEVRPLHVKILRNKLLFFCNSR